MMKRATAVLVFAAMASLGACRRGGGGGAGGGGGGGAGINLASATPEARDIYNQRCVTCHGASGGGDGPAGAALTPHPRNFGDQQWQATATDDNIRRAIVQGGAAVGRSPLMPPNPDLESRTEVVNGLVALIRTGRH